MNARPNRPVAPVRPAGLGAPAAPGLMDELNGAAAAARGEGPVRTRKARLMELDWRVVAPNPLNPRRSLRGKVDVNEIDLADFDDLPVNGKNNDPSTVVNRAAYLGIYPEVEAELDANYPGTEYVVVFGSRRRLGCEKHDVPLKAVVDDEFASDQIRFHSAAVKENLGREDLDPLDEAEAIAEQVRLCGGVQAEAARVLGYSAPFIKQRLDLTRLLPELKAIMRARGMSVQVARELGAKPQDQQWAAWEAVQRPEVLRDEPAGINDVNSGDGGLAPSEDPSRGGASKGPSAPVKGRPRQKVTFKLSERPEVIAETLASGLGYGRLSEVVAAVVAKNLAAGVTPQGLAQRLRAELPAEQVQELLAELSR